MAGAGFAAGFFGEATNIMRERGKQKREDELIAEERKQKDADWARQTEHELNMVTARYDMETKAARSKKVEEATAALKLYKQAGGAVSTALEKAIAEDPDNAVVQINMMLKAREEFGMKSPEFGSWTATVGLEGATPESAASFKTEVSGSGGGGFNAFGALDSIAPAPAPMKPETVKLIREDIAISAANVANRRVRLLESEDVNLSGTDLHANVTRMYNAAAEGNTVTAMGEVGVKALFDTIVANAESGINILQHPDIKRDPALYEKLNTIINTTTFGNVKIDSPYEAAAILASNREEGLVPDPEYYATLEEFVKTFTVDFLQDQQMKDYYKHFPPK